MGIRSACHLAPIPAMMAPWKPYGSFFRNIQSIYRTGAGRSSGPLITPEDGCAGFGTEIRARRAAGGNEPGDRMVKGVYRNCPPGMTAGIGGGGGSRTRVRNGSSKRAYVRIRPLHLNAAARTGAASQRPAWRISDLGLRRRPRPQPAKMTLPGGPQARHRSAAA